MHNLQQLISDFPQSGLLHALLSCITDGENLQQAAVYYDPKVLYRLNKDPESLPAVYGDQIIQPDHIISGAYFHTEENDEELLIAPWTDGFDIKTAEAEHNYSLSGLTETEELPGLVEDPGFGTEHPPVTDDLQVDANAPGEEIQHETPAEHHVEKDPFTEDDILIEPLITLEKEEPVLSGSIDDEIFDEIVGIDDINLARKNAEGVTTVEGSQDDAAETTKEGSALNHRKANLTDEEEKLILGNIAATDFFVFDEALGDKKKTEEPVAANLPPIEETKQSAADNHVSKYHDEKMPYSFMWWLDKTRKEHAGVYQPFAEFKHDAPKAQKTSTPDELQQQYYENIFHLTSVEELERSTGKKPFEFGVKKREDEIIERFIQEVPQIKPQSGDRLDNENKAKKSSEDQDELVTETLAQIYIDQMLYPKAIATYKKLILKFPEKSRYFASQIEQLEKRTS